LDAGSVMRLSSLVPARKVCRLAFESLTTSGL
jgi:hypothetical protein